MTNEEIFRLAEQHGDWDDFGRWVFKNDDQLLKFVKAIADAEKQDPVAWAEITKEYVAISDEPFENAIPLYTEPPKVHEISMEKQA
jgi:hypothetical protein